MVLKVYSIDGNELREIEVADDIFNHSISNGSIYYAIKNELANLRVGTACTKTRSEVKGTHQKLYRQKGTGRARAGSKRSPVRVGGGVAFGPRPRSYNYHMPRKIKRLAMKSILSMKNQENIIRVIEDFTVENGRTKEIMSVLKKHTDNSRTVLIIQDDNRLIKRAGANLPWLTTLTFNKLRAHDLFYSKKLIFQESAIMNLNELYKVE